MSGGKYDEVLPNLPGLPTPDLNYQQRVDQRKLELIAGWEAQGLSLTPEIAADVYRVERDNKEAAEDVLSAINLNIAALEQLLDKMYTDRGIKSIKLADGTSVFTQPEPVGQILNPEALRLWFITNGLERSLTVNWNTANSLVKERLLNGLEPPDGMQVYRRTKIVLRRR